MFSLGNETIPANGLPFNDWWVRAN